VREEGGFRMSSYSFYLHISWEALLLIADCVLLGVVLSVWNSKFAKRSNPAQENKK